MACNVCVWLFVAFCGFACGELVVGCDASDVEPMLEAIPDPGFTVKRLFPARGQGAPSWMDCMSASPLAIESRGESQLLVAAGSLLTAVNAVTGSVAWQVELTSVEPSVAWIVATPVVVADKLVVAFQRTFPKNRQRISHHVAVVDLEARTLDPSFPELELQATKPGVDGDDVVFSPLNAVSRATLVHAAVSDRTLGLVYVAFGNSRDVQPWHGWVFELDLDPWRNSDTERAISSVLLTSPESECGRAGVSGSNGMLCGAGIWSPAGPKVYPKGNGYELLIPTGNGLLDLDRHGYANAVLRVGRGLEFDPHCDASACSDFDASDPQRACIETCRDLFVPRLLPGEPPLRPESGACDGMTLLECYAKLDWDLGANSPAKVELASGRSVLVMPGKDGAIYLFDAEHFGTLYDRKQIVAPCGTATDKCRAHWAGMMVTEPLIMQDPTGAKLVLASTFNFDSSHPAGVVALRIDEGADGPRLEPLWRVPDFRDPIATRVFRHHTSRLASMDVGGTSYAFAVNIVRSGAGSLIGIRVRDGAVAASLKLEGPGQRFVAPLVIGNRIYVPSCDHDTGPSHIEAFEFSSTPER